MGRSFVTTGINVNINININRMANVAVGEIDNLAR